ncbi:glycosyltransferase [Echria macrotheca]|uniref:Dol-P-Glc:Glc(2)Man(9)GlcNAc(2)-PP-Dol alpha-1,2-glucosyltransferase n=1 Tax=Echria macrotheca TaxID=438768 RepID=A0AAJ0BC32_9PEZI|nr:glycosyltransferase [Echria macrotheca]
MESLKAIRGALNIRELLAGAGSSALVLQFLPAEVGDDTRRIVLRGLFVLFLAIRSWLALVEHYVPEPYLDEFFHIPQAQTYCEGRFWDWDDKITTPPGLYLLSVATHQLFMFTTCSTLSLRSTNLLATLLTAMVATRCHMAIQAQHGQRSHGQSLHTGLNIALFPVIFFFSALYYTDVVSTLAVLIAYENHLTRVGEQRPGILNDVWTVVLGLAALLMRQTNVFWVVVYMGGLEAVHALRQLRPAPVEVPKNMSLVEHVRFYLWRDSVGERHDPPLGEAWPEDWLFCTVSIGVAALFNPGRVLRQIWPHITILSLFAGFVAWNGGVVLGDKSNHVATIHLAQMLYIWPFFAFFSAPLLIPSLLSLLNLPRTKTLATQMTKKIYYIPYILVTLGVSVAIVKYNTIIHPFTLADNRHYMFYIFRYTILRSIPLRYALVAAYTLARWLVWDTLSGSPSPSTNQPPPTTTPKYKPNATPSPANSPNTSTALLWLLATTLSLVTAPLVEPRYFILPWVFWRLLVPAWRPSDYDSNFTGLKWLRRMGGTDPRLVLESVWFLMINAGTMYMFLFRPFYWRDAEGNVADGGRVQRFMW